MRSYPGELQPAQAISQRVQALQHELQQARQSLRRERRRQEPDARWNLNRDDAQSHNEEWLITYLDMVTLLMVAMIMMLALAGTFPEPEPPRDARSVSHFPIPNDTQSARADAVRVATQHPPLSISPPSPAIAEASSVPALTPVPKPSPEAAAPSAAVAVPTPVLPSLAAPPAAATDSEGETVAASLALGELGKEVEVLVNRRSVSFRVNSEILFGTGQADLSPEGLSVLKRMAQVLVKAGYDVTVEGHTDSVRVRSNAPYPSNWELSSARAGRVVRYLLANGIPKSRLKAVGFADSRPIADNDTAEGRAHNRRVELVVTKHHEE